MTNYFDRLGRITNILTSTSSRRFTFDDSGLVLSETNVAGPLVGVGLTPS